MSEQALVRVRFYRLTQRDVDLQRRPTLFRLGFATQTGPRLGLCELSSEGRVSGSLKGARCDTASECAVLSAAKFYQDLSWMSGEVFRLC